MIKGHQYSIYVEIQSMLEHLFTGANKINHTRTTIDRIKFKSRVILDVAQTGCLPVTLPLHDTRIDEIMLVLSVVGKKKTD